MVVHVPWFNHGILESCTYHVLCCMVFYCTCADTCNKIKCFLVGLYFILLQHLFYFISQVWPALHWYSFCFPGGITRLSWPRWLINTERVQMQLELANVTHPSTNQSRCRITTLIQTNALLATANHQYVCTVCMVCASKQEDIIKITTLYKQLVQASVEQYC